MSLDLSLEDKLKRLVYLNTVDNQFFVGNPDQYQKDVSELRQTTIDAAIENDLKELFAVLDAANKDNNLPRRSIIFLILGKLMDHKGITPEHKSKITAKVLQLSQSDEDFFHFIKYYTQLRQKNKMPSSVEKAVRKFYNNKTPLELAHSVAKYNRMHKWSHKDLIKLAHVKSDTPLKNIVFNYILYRKPSDAHSEEELKVLEIIKKSDELKKTKEAVDAIPILATLKLTMDQVSPSLQQNGEVWSAAIPNMSIQQILPHLTKLYKLGLFRFETTITNYLLGLFSSPEKVKASGIHPIEVFTFMKRLEKGGKPLDIKLLNHLQNEKKVSIGVIHKAQIKNEPKCNHILKVLWACFDLACNNVASSNKRYLVTIDVTSKARKAVCIGNKVVTFLEAAVAYAVVLLRTQKDVAIATYKDETIELIRVEKNVSFHKLLDIVMAQASNCSLLYAPVERANRERTHVDVFVNFIHNEYANHIPTDKKISEIRCTPITIYREKFNLPNAKVITFAPVKKYMPQWVDTPPNVLDILGFDVIACKVAECFSRGAFC